MVCCGITKAGTGIHAGKRVVTCIGDAVDWHMWLTGGHDPVRKPLSKPGTTPFSDASSRQTLLSGCLKTCSHEIVADAVHFAPATNMVIRTQSAE